NMSHEIRTPMNAIIGLSDLALMQGLSPKVKDYTTKINLSSKALLSLLNDILDYSKIEAGRLELEEASFSLEEVLENLSTLFALSTEQKGLELVFDVKANVSSRVIGDSLRLNQVLNNLLGNAIKFTDHGEVILRVSELERDNDSCVIRFEVVDTGIGISPENIRNLFTSFTQADSSIKRRFGGTGLGLTISKRVVEKMNGKIHLTSEVGNGSTFEFSIRLRLDKSNPVKLKDRVLPGARVLVVDDLASSRQFLNEILKSWKFEVTEASSGIEAIHAINASIEEKTPFQLMLVDWKMPGMNGIETIRKSRELIKIKDAEHMPAIIMVTAYSKEQLQREVSDVCLDSILIKPIIASNLLNAIANLNSAQKIELDNPSPKVLEESPHSNRNINILLVEDNLINQQVAREFLEREGMQVFVAQNGKECLQKMEQYPDLFHLILMDLHMPEMDGFEATRAIRQKPRWKNLPIIAMTAAALEKDRKACLDAGMNDHLAKPISRQELTKTIIHWLGAVSSDLVGGIKKSSASSLLVLPEDLPGFNFKLVMERTGLKEDLLLKILLESRQSIEEDIKKLRLEIETQDFSAAVLSAHRLKGGVSTMGAVLLSQALEQLEVELHEHKKVRNLNFLNQACEVTFSSLDILEQASKS
ncbi:MAG: response regulator, partial [Verrucomicrobiota bacterium]